MKVFFVFIHVAPGCAELRQVLETGTIHPRLHVFGHCHGSAGAARFHDQSHCSTLFVNAAQEIADPVIVHYTYHAAATKRKPKSKAK